MPGLPADHEAFARTALASYDRPAEAPLRLLSLSENATYLVDDDDPIVLRVHRPGYHSVDGIRSELAWMSALRADTPVLTPHLVPAYNGADVVAARVDEQVLYVDAVSFVAGGTAEENPEAVGYDELGRLTAHMHDHAADWPLPEYFTRFRWDVEATLGPQARWGVWQVCPGYRDGELAVVDAAADAAAAALEEFGQAPDRFGLIHADLRMANLMVGPAGLTVIDFDDCGWSWFLFDLAATVSFIEDTPAAETMMGDWLRGYREVRDIPDTHLAIVPTLVMVRRLMLTAWVASHADAHAAQAHTDGFASRTAALAQRYLHDDGWLADALG